MLDPARSMVIHAQSCCMHRCRVRALEDVAAVKRALDSVCVEDRSNPSDENSRLFGFRCLLRVSPRLPSPTFSNPPASSVASLYQPL
jgi:hypothetical protein